MQVIAQLQHVGLRYQWRSERSWRPGRSVAYGLDGSVFMFLSALYFADFCPEHNISRYATVRPCLYTIYTLLTNIKRLH